MPGCRGIEKALSRSDWFESGSRAVWTTGPFWAFLGVFAVEVCSGSVDWYPGPRSQHATADAARVPLCQDLWQELTNITTHHIRT